MKTTSSVDSTRTNNRGTRRHFVRTAMTVFALAAGCAGLLAGSGAASADGPASATTTLTATNVTTAAPKPVAIKPGSPLGSKVFGATRSVVMVKAGTTGTGPAKQDECDARAEDITDLYVKYHYAKEAEKADLSDKIDELEDQTMDRGCFLIY